MGVRLTPLQAASALIVASAYVLVWPGANLQEKDKNEKARKTHESLRQQQRSNEAATNNQV